jgi:predicted short-subunit dehydrogenase-like oxidoreductase (DUF2520 family)
MSTDIDAVRPPSWAIIGPGRLGVALSRALRAAGATVQGPLGRGEPVADPGAAVVLCVPDARIEAAARALGAPRLAGHCSGATSLVPLTDAGHEAFSVHPLMTITPGAGPGRLAGAPAAVAGATPRALAVAHALAATTGMRPFAVAEEDRIAYHAAACVASNLLVALEDGAERLAATAGVPRAALVPLVRAAVEAWAADGGERALTGPIARGDDATVAGHRAAIAERLPELLQTFDALAATTRTLAGRQTVPA